MSSTLAQRDPPMRLSPPSAIPLAVTTTPKSTAAGTEGSMAYHPTTQRARGVTRISNPERAKDGVTGCHALNGILLSAITGVRADIHPGENHRSTNHQQSA